MEIYGADINGIQGLLISFDGVIKEGSGVHLLGKASKVVHEGFVRARDAIETLNDDWGLKNCKVTIQLDPPATAKLSEGLDLPIAITLLKASLFQNTEKLDERIHKLEEQANKTGDTKQKEAFRKKLLDDINYLISQRKKISKFKKKIASIHERFVLIGSLNITTGKLTPTIWLVEHAFRNP